MISLPASSSGVASFASTIRSTVPNSPRTTARAAAGSAAKTLARAIAASSCAAGLEDRVEVRAGHQRHVAGQHEDLGRLGRDDRQRGPTASPVPRGSSWRANDRALGEGVDDGLDRRREDDDRAAAARPVGVLSQASRT